MSSKAPKGLGSKKPGVIQELKPPAPVPFEGRQPDDSDDEQPQGFGNILKRKTDKPVARPQVAALVPAPASVQTKALVPKTPAKQPTAAVPAAKPVAPPAKPAVPAAKPAAPAPKPTAAKPAAAAKGCTKLDHEFNSVEDIDRWITETYGAELQETEDVKPKEELNTAKFGAGFAGYNKVNTIGDGTCLLHAILMCVSKAYRRIKSTSVRSTIGQTFRRQIVPFLTYEGVPIYSDAEKQKTWFKELCITSYLDDAIVWPMSKFLGVNIAFFTDVVYRGKTIGEIRSIATKEEGKPWIFMFNDTERHYEAILPPEDVRLPENQFTIPFEIGTGLMEQYSGRDAAAARVGISNTVEKKCIFAIGDEVSYEGEPYEVVNIKYADAKGPGQPIECDTLYLLPTDKNTKAKEENEDYSLEAAKEDYKSLTSDEDRERAIEGLGKIVKGVLNKRTRSIEWPSVCTYTLGKRVDFQGTEYEVVYVNKTCSTLHLLPVTSEIEEQKTEYQRAREDPGASEEDKEGVLELFDGVVVTITPQGLRKKGEAAPAPEPEPEPEQEPTKSKGLLPSIKKSLTEWAMNLSKAGQENAVELERKVEAMAATTSTYTVDVPNNLYQGAEQKTFYQFIQDQFSEFTLPPLSPVIDENACKRDNNSLELNLYQQFIREYMNSVSPYRGILVYHGLGSGKTCTAIAAAEALYNKDPTRKIVVFTPSSLQENFINELSFCGFKHYRLQNHWESFEVDKTIKLFAVNVMGIPEGYLGSMDSAAAKARDQGRDYTKRIWLPNFDKEDEPNFNTLGPEEQTQIRQQIRATITNTIRFIGYTGVSTEELTELWRDRVLDNAIIVIDEVHNLTRLMDNKLTKYLVESRGVRSESYEPITADPLKIPAKGYWIDTKKQFQTKAKERTIQEAQIKQLVAEEKKKYYDRAYIFYRLFAEARNSKIIALSGTPIVNYPTELAICLNFLHGYFYCCTMTIVNTVPDDRKLIEQTCSKHPKIGFFELDRSGDVVTLFFSLMKDGYEKIADEDGTLEGVVKSAATEATTITINDVYKDLVTKFSSIKDKLAGTPDFFALPLFPVDRETFTQKFINDNIEQGTITFKKEAEGAFAARIAGLISYYKGAKAELMPSATSEVVYCVMSGHQTEDYLKVRSEEIRTESKKKKSMSDDMEEQQSSYRFGSRSASNFSFPDTLERPRIGVRALRIAAIAEQQDSEGGASIGGMTQEQLEAQKKAEEASKAIAVEQAAMNPEEGAAGAAGSGGEGSGDEGSEDEDGQKGGVFRKKLKPEAPKSEGAPAPAPAAATAKKPAPATGTAAPAATGTAAAELPKPQRKLQRLRTVAAPTEEGKGKDKKATVGAPLDDDAKYAQDVQNVLAELRKNKDTYFRIEPEDAKDFDAKKQLRTYSEKYYQILQKIMADKDYDDGTSTPVSSLVYSAFKTVEGLGVFSIALEQQGYVPIVLAGTDRAPELDENTIASLANPDHDGKRYILYTGDYSPYQRQVLLNIFNCNKEKLAGSSILPHIERFKDNQIGQICRVFMITGAGAEGLSLKNVRRVHIMEPYWNRVRTDQVKGRAIRICSHSDLDYNKRHVDVYTYLSVLPEGVTVDPTIKLHDEKNGKVETTDTFIYNLAGRKEKLSENFLDIAQRMAVDCTLNTNENGVKCAGIALSSDSQSEFLYDPRLDVSLGQYAGTTLDTSLSPLEAAGGKQISKVNPDGTQKGFWVFEDKSSGKLQYRIYLASKITTLEDKARANAAPPQEKQVLVLSPEKYKQLFQK